MYVRNLPQHHRQLQVSLQQRLRSHGRGKELHRWEGVTLVWISHFNPKHRARPHSSNRLLFQTSTSAASPPTCAATAPASTPRAASSASASRATRAASWWWRTAWVRRNFSFFCPSSLLSFVFFLTLFPNYFSRLPSSIIQTLPLYGQTLTSVSENPCCAVEESVWTLRGVMSVNVPLDSHSAPTVLLVKVSHLSF